MRSNKANHSSNGRSRVRFMLVDFDGSSDDLQQLAQTFAQAVRIPAPVIVSPTQRLTGPATPAQLPPADSNGKTLFDAMPAADTVTDAEVDEVEVPAATKLHNGAKKKKFRTPKPLSHLEFKSGKSLKDYVTEISAKSTLRLYLAITQWFKEHRGVAEVSPDHVYTAYCFLNKPVPDDVDGPFRALKKSVCVEKGSAKGHYKITHIGENKLMKAEE